MKAEIKHELFKKLIVVVVFFADKQTKTKEIKKIMLTVEAG